MIEGFLSAAHQFAPLLIILGIALIPVGLSRVFGDMRRYGVVTGSAGVVIFAGLLTVGLGAYSQTWSPTSSSPANTNAVLVSWPTGTPASLANGQTAQVEMLITNPSSGVQQNNQMTLVMTNANIATIPAWCLTKNVTPASSLSSDHSTLICNVGELGGKPYNAGGAVSIVVNKTTDTAQVSGKLSSASADTQSLPSVPITGTAPTTSAPIATPAPTPSKPFHVPGWLIIAGVASVSLLALLAFVLVAWRQAKKAGEARAKKREIQLAILKRWTSVVERHKAVLGEYGALELDTVNVLKLPMLFGPGADPDGPTGKFVAALDTANSLRTETVPPPEFLDRYVESVDVLVRAWSEAKHEAERIGTSQLDPDVARKVNWIIGMLNKSKNTDNDFEHRAYFDAAKKLLDELVAAGHVRVPEKAALQLAAERRRELAIS